MTTESGGPTTESGGPTTESGGPTSVAPAGWYPDPNTGQQRWWNGSEWGQFGTGQTQTQGTNGLAIASLVLGILWLGGLGALLATIFGSIALRQTRERNQGGRGLAIAGLVLGIIGVVGALWFWISIAVVGGSGSYSYTTP